MTLPSLDAGTAARFADIALANVVREYPNRLDHVLRDEADAAAPRSLHPAFYGSYDWHSCVHMHWLLVHVRRLHPGIPQRSAIDALLDRHLAPDRIACECSYLERPETRSFERTYGWAWLLKLAHELSLSEDANARRWSENLAPLTEVFVYRYLDYLPKADYPIRHGVHPNSAFGVLFALHYARCVGHAKLATLCEAKALVWFGQDRDAPASFEPSGADFLSPTFIEADLMRRVLVPAIFAEWLAGWLPRLEEGQPANVLAPVAVSDRTDPQIVHLDGLNLSRAWCARSIAAALPDSDARRRILELSAAAHLAAGLRGLDSADYLGAHWLASYAALALHD